MPFPFGVSVGDFVACLNLICKTRQAIKDSGGADSDFRGVIGSLDSLELALGKLDDITGFPDEQLRNLRHTSIRAQYSLKRFLQTVEKYHQRLQLGGSRNLWSDKVRKVQWALKGATETSQFNGEVRGCIDAIQLQLHVLQIGQTQTFHGMTKLQFDKVLQELERSKDLPPRILFHKPVVFTDAHGKHTPFQTQCISTWEHFAYTVNTLFKGRPGLAFTKTRAFVLRHTHHPDKESPRHAYFMSIFRPNRAITMSILFPYHLDFAHSCPSCGHADSEPIGSSFRCMCGMMYCRLEEASPMVIAFPQHPSEHPSKVSELEAFSEDADDTGLVSDDSEPFEPTSMHSENNQNGEHLPEDSEISGSTCGHSNGHITELGDNPSNFVAVDFGAPPLSIFTDIFGIRFGVPWKLLKSLEGMRFFLRWFTGGGPLYTWPTDFIVLDASETTVSPDSWKKSVLPGMELRAKLNVETAGGSGVVEANLRVRLDEFLRSLPAPLWRSSTNCTAKHILRSISAHPAAVVELLFDKALNHEAKRAVVDQNLTIGQSARNEKTTCLVCGGIFESNIELALHAQTHLKIIPCIGACEACAHRREAFDKDTERCTAECCSFLQANAFPAPSSKFERMAKRHVEDYRQSVVLVCTASGHAKTFVVESAHMAIAVDEPMNSNLTPVVSRTGRATSQSSVPEHMQYSLVRSPGKSDQVVRTLSTPSDSVRKCKSAETSIDKQGARTSRPSRPTRWLCCRCGQSVTTSHWGYQCPADGHQKCVYCAAYVPEKSR